MKMLNTVTRDEVVIYLVDVLGYSIGDTDGYTKSELWEWLTDQELGELAEYSDNSPRVTGGKL